MTNPKIETLQDRFGNSSIDTWSVPYTPISDRAVSPDMGNIS
jgi:hypothetical protein